MFYGYLWNDTLVEIQSYFIASVEMRVRKKKQQRKQISGQKSSKKQRVALLARPGKYGKMKDHLESLHQGSG